MSSLAIRLALRGAAIAIAILAFADPAFVRSRHDRIVVAVTVGHGMGEGTTQDRALAARIRERLARDFDVVAGAYPGADALVVAGDRLPPDATEFRMSAFAIVPDAAVTVESVGVPPAASMDGVAGVRAGVRARGVRGRVVTTTLVADGVPVDRVSRKVESDDERLDVILRAPTIGRDVMPLRVAVRVDGLDLAADADAAVRVDTARWAVLVHDTRPSWMSTFVRRALERDRRFAVSTRIGASKDFALATGGAPRLTDAAGRDRFDAIVVGAADGLSAADAAALDDFMRRRGGSVVLLLDAADAADAAPVARLTGVRQWISYERALAAVAAPRTDSAGLPLLRIAEAVWPASLPPVAEPLGVARAARTGGDSAARPVVWALPVGAGHLVVSGALDGWRYRDSGQSQFDDFWRSVVAAEAARAWPPLDVAVTPAVARPGDRVEVSVVVRAAALGATASERGTGAVAPAPVAASVSARLGDTPLRLVPDAASGRLVAFARARRTALVTAQAGGFEARAPMVVAADAAPAGDGQSDALAAWVQSRGGAVIRESGLAALPDALLGAVRPAVRVEPWHPFRSAWWIVPFALLLSAEWYLRRRGALA